MRQHERGLLQTVSAFLASQIFKRLGRKGRNVGGSMDQEKLAQSVADFQVEVSGVAQSLQLGLNLPDRPVYLLTPEDLDRQRTATKDAPVLIAQFGQIDATQQGRHSENML